MNTNPKRTKYNNRINVMNAIFAAAALNLVSPFYSKYAQRLGGGDFHIALLTALPYLVSFFAYIPGSLVFESLPDKKKTLCTNMFIQKLFLFAIACIPFFSGDHALIFVCLIGAMNFFGAISNMGYQALIGDIFEPQDRSMAMGRKNRASSIVGILMTLLGGQLLHHIPKNDAEVLNMYQIFYFMSFTFALIETYLCYQFQGVPTPKKKKENTVELLRSVLRDIPRQKRYVMFVLAAGIFYIGWIGAQPLFSIYTIKILKATEGWLSLIAMTNALASILSYPKWAKLADKIGNPMTLTLAIIGMGITPLLYVMASRIWMLVFFNILIGISVAGTTLCMFNILLEITPSENRTVYLAVYNTIIAVIAGISPLLFVRWMNLAGMTLALILAAIMRLSATFFFYKIKNCKK